MNRYQTCHPVRQSQAFVAAFGERFTALVLARLALGEIQSTVF